MLNFLGYILENYNQKNIVLVSHGGAIKFLLGNWCRYEYETNSFVYNNEIVCSAKLESPSILKLTFIDSNLVQLEKIEI